MDNEKRKETTPNPKKESNKSQNTKAQIDLRRVLEQDVTWTAIATIGGAAIVFWNAIKYIIVLNSSFVLYVTTKVPMYLLVIRKNLPFSDAYIFYLTIIAVIYCFAGTKYNFFPRIKKTYLFLMMALYIMLVAFFPMSIMPFHLEKYRFLILGLRDFIMPLLLIVVSYFGAAQYKDNLLVEESAVNVENNSFYAALNKETKKYKKYLFCGQLIMILTAIGFILSSTAESYNYQVDQDDRFIVADLGERYIVLDADYKIDEHILYVDNSHYSIIDSSNETVRVIENVKIQPV